MQLYTVRFTTKRLVTKYNSKGNVESQINYPNEVCLTALPLKTAMSYSGCDDFVKEIYQPDPVRKSKRSTPKRTYESSDTATAGADTSSASALTAAAETGDMGASLNV